MDLSKFERVSALIGDRKTLVSDIAAIEAAHQIESGWLGVTFQGRYQSESILKIVRPAVVSHLRGHLARIDQELKALGVAPDA